MTAGIILAAGKGSRLRRGPKAFVSLKESSFLALSERILLEGGIENFVAVLPPNHPKSAQLIRQNGARYLENHRLNAGPLWSILLGLKKLEQNGQIEKLLLHHVDHPLVSPKTIQILLAVPTQKNIARIVPTYHGKIGHPIIVLSPGIQALRDTSDPETTTLREVLYNAGAVLEIPTQDSNILRNLNTLEEIEKCT